MIPFTKIITFWFLQCSHDFTLATRNLCTIDNLLKNEQKSKEFMVRFESKSVS